MSLPDDYQRMDPAQLRPGHFVRLELGWLRHPFPSNAFRIRDAAQVEQIRALNLESVLVSPSRSAPEAGETASASDSATTPPCAAPETAAQARLERQRTAFIACEENFSRAAASVRTLLASVSEPPAVFRQQMEAFASGMVQSVLSQQDIALTVIGDNRAGYDDPLHGTNVMVMSLLLGRQLGLDADTLQLLGEAALLHDVGKTRLPGHLARRLGQLQAEEQPAFLRHTELGVDIARQLGLPETIIEVIAQHHEYLDGSGGPQGLQGEAIRPLARIVAIVNVFDDFCNKPDPAHSLTPYEALARMYARDKAHFDPGMLAAFIRSMGVYPPGSLVRLSTGQAAIVRSANPEQALRPVILAHDAGVDRSQALLLDLATTPSLNIVKALRPAQLSPEEFAYLAPRQRVTYFFDELASPVDDPLAS